MWLLESQDSHVPGVLRPLEVRSVSTGLYVRIPVPTNLQTKVIARLVPSAPGRMVVRTGADQLRASNLGRFDKAGGLLAGFFIALAAFAAVVALLNRDLTFWLFAGWLVTTYRVAAINGGWDLGWMGLALDTDAALTALRLTAAMHGLLTAVLFLALFRGKLPRRICLVAESIAIGFAVIVLITPIVSNPLGQAMIRIVGTAGVVIHLVGLVAICRSSLERPLMVAAVAWALNLVGTLMTILYAAGIIEVMPRTVNSQTAAIFSGFLVAIALADRLRSERVARLRAQTAAVAALQKFQTTYDSVPSGLFSMREDGRFVDVNPAFRQMLDLPADRNIANTWPVYFSEEDLNVLLERLDKTGEADTEVAAYDGERWFHINARRSNSLIEGAITEITARRLAQAQLRHLADHDPLTQMLNRRGFDVLLDEQFERSANVGGLCLASLDLDRFKLVNDLFGHASGDRVLEEVARRLQTSLQGTVHLARVGGDEFVILMCNFSIGQAQRMCETMIESVFSESFIIGDKSFAVCGSVGLVEVSEGMTARDALSASDRACAQAKSGSGHRVVVYRHSAPEVVAHFEELRMVARMGLTLPFEQMRMVCQPIVSLQAAYSSINYEALLRVVDENGEPGSPHRLIQAAERHGFMARVDRWVLGTMLDWLDAHPEHRDRVNYCAINLSGASLNDERFLDDVMSMIGDHPASVRRICFEVTETVALYDLRNTRRFIDRVRECGAKVALDDFGAGYTSFKYLRELPVDLIKIDGAYVRSIVEDRSNYAITRTIVDLARELGASSVAEWAETPEIVAMLAKMGVDYAQGFALARPMPPERILDAFSCGDLVVDPVVVQTLRNPQRPTLRLQPSLNVTGIQ